MPVSITILYSSPLRISSRRRAHRECDRKKQFQFNASRNFSFWSSKCGAGEASAKFQIGRRATFFLSYSSDSLFSLIIKKFSSRNLQWHIEMAIMNLEIEHDGLLSFSGLIFLFSYAMWFRKDLRKKCEKALSRCFCFHFRWHPFSAYFIAAVKQKVEELICVVSIWVTNLSWTMIITKSEKAE